MSENDLRILELARAGDPEGAALLVDAYSGFVRSYLVRLVGPDAAEDVTQETFIRASAHLARFRGESSLSWWLARIASHAAARYRGRARRTVVPLEGDVPSLAPGPEERALEEADRGAARQALADLPRAERQLLMMREVLGLSYEEIRQRLAIPFLGTVRSRLHKARELLKRTFDKGQEARR
jgi:RNA polymerase sigma-70 factor (ECF subfamily)